MTTLSFYDFHRQSYAEALLGAAHGSGRLERGAEGEFMVGGYVEGGGVDERGEFKILLLDLHSRNDAALREFMPLYRPTPQPLGVQVCVFTDAFGALREFEQIGALDRLEDAAIWSRDDLSHVLLDLGLRDESHNPLPKEATRGS